MADSGDQQDEEQLPSSPQEKASPAPEEGRRSTSRLREIMRRPRRDSDTQPDAPLLDFQYNDTDSLDNELSELYSYTEENDFQENAIAFQAVISEYSKDKIDKWSDMEKLQKIRFILYVLEKLEVVNIQERRNAAQSLLYLVQGAYKEQEDYNNCLEVMKENVLILYKCGVYTTIQRFLIKEADNAETVQLALQKASISIADSVDLRIYLNILYMMTEVLCHFSKSDERVLKAADSLREELAGNMETEDGQPFACALFDLVLKFCAGSSPHYPIKKILLLLWKVVLFTLGGFKELTSLLKEARVNVGLSATFGEQHAKLVETERVHKLRPSSPTEERSQRLKPRKTVDLDDDDIDFIPAPITESHHYLEKVLLLRPKVRNKDVTTFLENCRLKYIGFQLHNDDTTTAGLPHSVVEGLNVLKSHMYTSLSEVQIKQEEEHVDRPFSKGVLDLPVTNAEILYKSLLPNLPQYMIALLKILLASAPTAKAKTESINILTDVLPPEMPTTVLQSMQLGIDVNRHKEIMVKSISALILLLLKHLKVNHVYQFEFVSQHLVFANCIPLVLKFFNQNISAYVSAKNSIPQLNFPNIVLDERHEITVESLEQPGDASQDFCWRNLFSCINLLRILQKLTKWKYSRTMMLVVFKSAPILKRALKIREENLQLYVLKNLSSRFWIDQKQCIILTNFVTKDSLLKTQIKYLGRNWRKTNMRIMSLIYHKIRHRLNDDWAFGNDVDARPWDFQTEECAIRHNVDLFNYHHYEANGTHYPGDLQPVDNNLHSVLNQPVVLSENFKKNYTKWMDREVFNTCVDWDELLDENEL